MDAISILSLLSVMFVMLVISYFVVIRYSDTATPAADGLIAADKIDNNKNEEEKSDKEKDDKEKDKKNNVDRYQNLYNYFFKYVEGNLRQDQNIYRVTLGIFFIGLGIVIFGIAWSITQENAALNWGAIAAGILTQFIAGTILVVYRTVNRQTMEYFNILQDYVRLEAAFRIVEDLDDDDDTGIKIETKAAIAKMLLERETRSSKPATHQNQSTVEQ